MPAQKTILITGCSSGIGYHSAKLLQQRGWRVLASCRQSEDVARLQAEGLECVQLDVDDSASIQQALQQVMALTQGRLDALFNNAGFGQPGAAEDISRTAMREQFETNLFGAWELTNAVLPIMRAQGHGRIVFNGSILGFAAMRWRAAYNASKFAMEGLCDTLRLELQGSHIFVSLLEPGPISSEFRANALVRLQKHINIEHSAHHHMYQQELARLEKVGAAAPFTLPGSAVAEALYQAISQRRPAARYRVTFPSKLFWILKRLLPNRCFDWIVRRAA
ncbi:SDR family oxidoreductase [Neisseriaceae bacterium TC5R-5]|nr:SDR family oxidoreductase [Neisseriaceae bacterium TC5R-5]